MSDDADDLSAVDDGPTPENTPLPGGGAWTWDNDTKAWVTTAPQPE
ncbi:MAG TPA: hypothetical protein PK861_01570 [Thermomonas sp.]|nr:hypothetical protein [Thermomonas sp.]